MTAEGAGRDDTVTLVEGYADVADVESFVADLGSIADDHGCVVQAFDARSIAGERHLRRALSCARRAFERDDAIARDPGVEVLLYAAGRRQIEDALELGVDEGEGPVVVLAADDPTRDGEGDLEAAAEAVRGLDSIEPADLERGEELGDPERLRAWFEIGDAELAATDADLEDLVVERVALLVVEK